MVLELDANQAQIQRIVKRKALRTSEYIAIFCISLVEKSLAGTADSLNEYTVGSDRRLGPAVVREEARRPEPTPRRAMVFSALQTILKTTSPARDWPLTRIDQLAMPEVPIGFRESPDSSPLFADQALVLEREASEN